MRRGAPFPALALVLAALGAACGGSDPDAVAVARAAADSADQMMVGVQMFLTSEGVRQAYLEADSAFVYEASGRTELTQVRLTFYARGGEQASVLTSNEGTYRTREGTMEARGDVVVVRADGGRLTTSILRFNQLANQVTTDQPYTYTSADRNVTGNGFVSDPAFTNITTQQVRGRAGAFTLPGQ